MLNGSYQLPVPSKSYWVLTTGYWVLLLMLNGSYQLPVPSTQKKSYWVLTTGYWVLLLMLVRYCFAQVHGGQQYKNVRLNKRDAHMQALEHNGKAERYQREKYQGHHFTGEHVRE